MPETVLLVPADLAVAWQDVSSALPQPIFGTVPPPEEELVDAAEVGVVALQVTGYIADVGGFAMLVAAVRQWFRQRQPDSADQPLCLRRREGEDRPVWLMLAADMSDDEIRKLIEEFLQSRRMD